MANALITKSLREENLSLLFNFPAALLTPHEKKLVDWIQDYARRYNKPPTTERLMDEFDTWVPVESKDPLGDVYDKTLKKKRNIHTREFLLNIQDELKKGADPVSYIQELHQTLKAGDAGVTLYTKVDRSAYTRKLSSFPYEIEAIDQHTGGIAKADLIYLIGRLGTGKTTFALWVVAKWLQRERRVLLASNENRAEDVVAKIDSYIGGWNPLRKRTATWNTDDIKRLSTVSYIASKMKGECIIPNKPVGSVKELANLVSTYRPDIVLVDGIYLMTGVAGESHWEKLTDVSRNLKRLAEEEDVPVFGIHQANRNAIGKRIDIEHIAYADALAQDADLLLAINRDEESKDLYVECIKNRWGGERWGFFLRMFFENMAVKVMTPKVAMEEDE